MPDRSSESTRRVAAEIPLEEIANAAKAVLAANLAMALEDLARETARLLGFGRMGNKLADRMRTAIRLLHSKGAAKIEGAQVALAD